MNTEEAYDQWADQYDTNKNRTRDLEAVALRATIAHIAAERLSLIHISEPTRPY